jgi:hypothetical protein
MRTGKNLNDLLDVSTTYFTYDLELLPNLVNLDVKKVVDRVLLPQARRVGCMRWQVGRKRAIEKPDYL